MEATIPTAQQNLTGRSFSLVCFLVLPSLRFVNKFFMAYLALHDGTFMLLSCMRQKFFVTWQLHSTILALVLLCEELGEVHDPYTHSKYLCFSTKRWRRRGDSNSWEPCGSRTTFLWTQGLRFSSGESARYCGSAIVHSATPAQAM